MTQVDMRVGALAKRSGLTVRTLHHYDDIGLLRPKRRTHAGHRIYGIEEVRRLQRIASLRQLGLSLVEIRDCLDGTGYDLEEVLELQVARIDEEIAAKTALRRRIVRLLHSIASPEGPTMDDLMKAIEATVRLETYYTREQLDRLSRRRDVVGDDRIQEVEAEWREIFSAFQRAMETGVEPSSPEVQHLATRSAALIGEFTGGDPDILESLSSMYRTEGPDKVMGEHAPSASLELWAYMAQARTLATASGDPADPA